MSMIAGVYFGVANKPPFDKHPCVVVLEIQGSDECLVIPAFTAGRESIENLIDFYVRDGVDEQALYVSMNNNDSVNWHRKVNAVEYVRWATIAVDRLDRSAFPSRPAGAMKPEYLLLIYRSLIAFFESKPGSGRFSKPIEKRYAMHFANLKKSWAI